MHLWTEYEGNTLAGYPLGRLTRSEGRSAFFSTTTPDGKPALLRLTESHFDDSELITRWQKIAAVKHPNLQAIAHSGQITFDGVALACCLLDPVDMSLSDVLRDRSLTVDETKEVAEAIAGALAALHAAGLIHEHLDATNVFAHGETITLRSDCARECHGDFEADTAEAREALRGNDVRDLGLLLLRCLAIDWPNTNATPLPRPFDRIIPGALNGTLTAQTIADTLDAEKPAPIAAPSQPAPISRSLKAEPRATTPRPTGTAASPDAVLAALASKVQTPVERLPMTNDRSNMGVGDIRSERRNNVALVVSAAGMANKAWLATAAAIVLLAAVVWTVASGRHTAPQQHAVVVQTPPEPAAKPSATTPQQDIFTTSAQAGWRVIAYTYNQEQQAQHKVMQIQARYATLRPQVFSPTGHAPYFVALGEPSDAASALALRNRARRAGLPRDTFARNF